MNRFSVGFVVALGAFIAVKPSAADPLTNQPQPGAAQPGAAPPPPPGYGYGYYPYPSPRGWRRGDPPPPGYHVEMGPMTGLIIGGAIPLGIFYVISLSAASISDFSNQSGWLVVPGAGPWLTLLARDRCHENDGSFDSEATDCAGDKAVEGLLVFDGIVQAAGLTMVIVGATTERERLVRDDYPTARVRVSPVRVGTGYGIGVSGEL